LRFDQDHAQLTGHAAPDEHVEIVNYRMTAVAQVPHVSIASPFTPAASADDARVGERETYLAGPQPVRTALYDRAKLPQGAEIVGPAILLQGDSTTVVGAAHRARVVALGQIEISTTGARSASPALELANA
jgi:N-methylhydantoinase A